MIYTPFLSMERASVFRKYILIYIELIPYLFDIYPKFATSCIGILFDIYLKFISVV